MRGSAVFDLFECRRHPYSTSFRGRDDIEVIEAPEEVALRCIALDSQCGELLPGDGPRLDEERIEDLDPENGDRFMVARGRSVLTTHGFVVSPDASPHMVDRQRVSEAMNVACPRE